MKRGFSLGVGTSKKSMLSDKSDEDDDIDEKDSDKITRENNHIYFYSEIDRDSTFTLNSLIRDAELYCMTTSFKLKIDPIPIYLHINSNGGGIYAAFTTIDAIVACSVPVHSIIEGSTASAGTLISVVCTKRYIQPNAYMLIHQLSSGLWGKMNEIEDEYKNLSELMVRIKQIYKDHSKIPRKELSDLLKHDLWLNSEKSIKYGLVDELWTR
jgi:ATP-dependent protease ClpP protease subunit